MFSMKTLSNHPFLLFLQGYFQGLAKKELCSVSIQRLQLSFTPLGLTSVLC
jgi:hypothetical protein